MTIMFQWNVVTVAAGKLIVNRMNHIAGRVQTKFIMRTIRGNNNGT